MNLSYVLRYHHVCRNDWDGDEALVKAQEAKRKEKRQAAFASIKK